MKVVGIQKVDYVKRDSGARVEGINLHTLNNKDERVEGAFCEVFYFGSASQGYMTAQTVKVGDEIAVSYNRWGRPDSLAIIK